MCISLSARKETAGAKRLLYRLLQEQHNARKEKRIVEANTRRQRDYAVNSKTSKQYSMVPMPRKRRR
ncbi:hypothetical protein Tcan_07806 [Toxocara canis]|uniref:Uncharacterized protein n=1 Tax=Toxocara canis TaxID=6265 RepID=A0A0B2W0Y1_TOXCA|nr:hypothetical protein Tcan_07806 [Toxocara canis]